MPRSKSLIKAEGSRPLAKNSGSKRGAFQHIKRTKQDTVVIQVHVVSGISSRWQAQVDSVSVKRLCKRYRAPGPAGRPDDMLQRALHCSAEPAHARQIAPIFVDGIETAHGSVQSLMCRLCASPERKASFATCQSFLQSGTANISPKRRRNETRLKRWIEHKNRRGIYALPSCRARARLHCWASSIAVFAHASTKVESHKSHIWTLQTGRSAMNNAAIANTF